MLLKLFLAFTLLPILEIYLLMEVGSAIGSLQTLLLVIASGFAGAYLARMQGLYTMVRVRASLQQGIMPTEDLLDAVIILVAGVVLLTPGFITDAAGLLLLIPESRNRFKIFLRKKFEQHIERGSLHIDRHP
jgi:UPF0716 protein FxsA